MRTITGWILLLSGLISLNLGIFTAASALGGARRSVHAMVGKAGELEAQKKKSKNSHSRMRQ